MAYVLHITRKKDWGDDEPKITQEEWNGLKEQSVLEPTGLANYPNSTYAKWSDMYFSYRNGDITSVSPNEQGIQKMKEIASILHAKVQGDDGEYY
ncbi:MAG: hypothetical protein NTY06_03490 [Candidatus Gottesmanbacteria bacterium]|nr:hypothetical protein [Candidatus Gottesmanbacteria bacterium]